MLHRTLIFQILTSAALVVAAASGVLMESAAIGGAPQAQIDNTLQSTLDNRAAHGGGTVTLRRGEILQLDRGLVIPERVTLDLNGGELVFTLTVADDAGVRLLSYATIENGTVTVRSRGRPGTQGSIHAPIFIGEFYGAGNTPQRPSPFSEVSHWTVRNVTVSSDKLVRDEYGIAQGAAGVAVMAGAHDGLIEGVTVADSSTMMGGIQIDWGTVGPIASATIPRNAALYRAGGAYTLHPHNIVVRNIRIGRLTRPAIAETGSFGVRLSGVDNITVENVKIASVTEAAFLHTAGDLGYEFARPADRQRAHKGIRVSGITLSEANGAYLLRSDSYADNVGRAAAAGYRPMLAPIAYTDIIISNVSGRAGKNRPANYGLRLNHQRGGTFTDIVADGFRRGFYIDEQVFDVSLVRPTASDSLEAGISVEHPSRPPARVSITNARLFSSRGSAAAERLVIGRSDDVRVSGELDGRVQVKREAGRFSLPANATVERVR